MTGPDSPKGEWFPVVLFAVRLAGEDGWIVDEAPMALSEVEAAIRANGHDIVEIRQISRGASRCRGDDGSPLTDGPMEWYVRSWGWTHDEIAECWRAPGEMPCEPAESPGSIESFVVQAGVPDAGWWPILVQADTASLEIKASNVHDPVRDLLAWLDLLVAGRAARVLIEEEGEQTEFRVYPKEEGTVRLLVFDYGEEADEKVIDGMVSLRDVVAQFYAALQQLAHDKRLFKQGWVFHLDSVAQPPFSSDAVEAFLTGGRKT